MELTVEQVRGVCMAAVACGIRLSSHQTPSTTSLHRQARDWCDAELHAVAPNPPLDVCAQKFEECFSRLAVFAEVGTTFRASCCFGTHSRSNNGRRTLRSEWGPAAFQSPLTFPFCFLGQANLLLFVPRSGGESHQAECAAVDKYARRCRDCRANGRIQAHGVASAAGFDRVAAAAAR
jgi:hypothetical protein